MAYLGGSWREFPLFFIGFIIMCLVAEGYLDNYLLIVVPSLFVILVAYLRSNYLRRKNLNLIRQSS